MEKALKAISLVFLFKITYGILISFACTLMFCFLNFKDISNIFSFVNFIERNIHKTKFKIKLKKQSNRNTTSRTNTEKRNCYNQGVPGE